MHTDMTLNKAFAMVKAQRYSRTSFNMKQIEKEEIKIIREKKK